MDQRDRRREGTAGQGGSAGRGGPGGWMFSSAVKIRCRVARGDRRIVSIPQAITGLDIATD